VRLLLVSDLHRDLRAASAAVERAPDVDVVVGAGDFAVQRRGLEGVVGVLSSIRTPTVLVAGNGESADELQVACSGWETARVLHGSEAVIDGVTFFGLGGGVPLTPFGTWSWDLTEDEARELLAECPEGAVLVSHSPPRGHVDRDTSGRHLGSEAVLEAIERTHPRLVVCGHVHASWGERSDLDGVAIVNAGPEGLIWDLD